jgi:hypothetical protein
MGEVIAVKTARKKYLERERGREGERERKHRSALSRMRAFFHGATPCLGSPLGDGPPIRMPLLV